METEINNYTIMLTGFSVFLIMMGLWTMDISVSAINIGNVRLEGLFFIGTSPRVMYHIGLIIVTAGMMLMVCIINYLWVKK